MNDHNNSINPETAMATSTLTMIQALRSAMDVMLERDDNVVIYGQDVGYFGGVFRCTEGPADQVRQVAGVRRPDLGKRHRRHRRGHGRLRPAPGGGNPVRRLLLPGSDQIVSEMARLRYRSAGEFIAPLTLRMPCGGGIYGGQTHSQSPEAMFTQVCGLRTVMPSNPYDAKGLA
jgi:branched-chain alpha-keto acid dehydrogenase E1 component (EC 1.2.4.4)